MLSEELGTAPRENILNISTSVNDDANKPSGALSRAEARKRRILENSASRLAKITGREEEPQIVENKCCSEVHPDLPSVDIVDDATVFYRDRIDLQEPVTSLFDQFESMQSRLSNEPRERRFADVFFESRLHIPLICIFAQTVYMLNSMKETYLFLPLLMWEFAEILCFKIDYGMSAISFLLPLLRLSSSEQDILTKIFQIIFVFSTDALLYTFTLIVLHFVVHLCDMYR